MTLGRMHLVLIDEADGMTNPAQLALLSKLDATAFPPNTIFVFTCNGTDGVWSKISNALKRLGFRYRNFLAQLFLKPQKHVQSGFED
jgi:DNA polymerase III delta prime subunit